jgi:hypothetical protein
MNTQKQFGQFVGALVQNLPDLTTDEIQGWIGNPKGMQNLLAGLSRPIAKVVSFIASTYKLMVDYGRSIAASVKAGAYNWANEDINDKNFPNTEYDQNGGEKEMALFHFNRVVSSQDAIAGMKAEGYRPATAREILAFGETNPNVQREFPVIALGQVVELNGLRQVVYLCRRGSDRKASLSYCGGDWNGGYRFLGVRI